MWKQKASKKSYGNFLHEVIFSILYRQLPTFQKRLRQQKFAGKQLMAKLF